ncbi:DUF2523 family protein [Pelomonas aquatica]|jgi:hypothetical protein|uniref:DUF2523 domain-containing protein n=1 Tax=Pelomonas aquatica TaxID=431058 RepID=A0A9X4LE20_9BURK|nr:DUF2523 family protein [Pelomonas aquatica]MCY4753225.1 DUF2523 family protein [Pelomonas aquatica]MDG0861306.1 DUF2523 domain-containing protein [Pelomonas aquatica]
MNGLLAAIASLAAPMAARVLASLGFGVVSIIGASLAVDQIKGLVLMSLGSVPTAIMQIAGLAGCWTALGMVFGAVTFTVTLFGLTKAVRLAGLG